MGMVHVNQIRLDHSDHLYADVSIPYGYGSPTTYEVEVITDVIPVSIPYGYGSLKEVDGVWYSTDASPSVNSLWVWFTSY